MVIIKDIEDSEETTTYTKKEIGESPLVVTEYDSQRQQPPSHGQRCPPPPPPGIDSQTLIAGASYQGQSAPVSGHQGQYACQSSSSSMPRGDQWQHDQKSSRLIPEPQCLYGQGSYGPMPNQGHHHYHPGGSSNPSSSCGIAQRDPHTAFCEPQLQEGHDIFERAQRGVNPTNLASSKNTMFANDQENMRLSELGNMAATSTSSRPNNAATTDTPVNAGPLPSASTTFDMPNGSRSKRKMQEMPAPGPSKSKLRTSEMSCSSNTIPSRSNVPGVSSASRRTTKDTAGKEESLDDILAKALKPNINKAIATLMGRRSAQNVQMEENELKMQGEDVDGMAPQEQNGEEEENVDGKEEAENGEEKENVGGIEEAGNGDEESNEVLDPAPLNFAVADNCDFNALSLELRESILKAKGQSIIQTKQRNKACLVGKERTSFNDLPDSVMQMVNNFAAKWSGTYRYTLSQRLNGWLIERKQRINRRYDSYYHHETSGGFFRSIIEMARFILREEYPSKGKSLKEDVVPVNQELQVHNGGDRSNVGVDLSAELGEGKMEQELHFTTRNQPQKGEGSTSPLSPPLKPPHKVLKRKLKSIGCEAAAEETGSILQPNLETGVPDSAPAKELDLPILADSSAATINLESFMQQVSALDVVFPTEMNDIDSTYGANHVFDDDDQLIDHIETCESLEDLYNFLHGNNGKKPNNDLP